MRRRITGSAVVLAVLLSSTAQGATAGDAVRYLELQVNGRCITELLGPVDYDYVYCVDGGDAYALADLEALQRTPAAMADSVWEVGVPVYPAGHGPDFLTAADQESARTASADRGTAAGEQAAAPDTAGRVPGRHTPARDADEQAAVSDTATAAPVTYETLAKWAQGGRGDPRDYDLSGVDVAALRQRPLPMQVARTAGVRLGVRPCAPETCRVAPVTMVVAEHGLAERRRMRLELRDFYLRWPRDLYLRLQVDQLTEDGDTAVANVKWSLYDSDARAESAGGGYALHLERTSEGWRVVDGWAFLERLMASL